MKFSSSSIIAILATGILSAPVTGTSANSPGIVGQSADASTQLENRKEVSLTMYEDKEEAHGFCEDEVNDGNCYNLEKRWNDRITSLNITGPPGSSCCVHQNGGCGGQGGEHMCFEQGENLPNLKIAGPDMKNFNDLISSLRCYLDPSSK